MNGNIYPRNPGFQVMHWHEDLQFIYMLEGEIEVVTLETRTSLHAGEGIFINKNVVHLVHKLETCHYNSFIFPDYFLKFYPSSPTSNIVDQLVGKESLPVYLFSLEEKNTAVLQTLQKLVALETHKTPLYPYEILTTLCELWLAFCRVATTSDFSPKKQPPAGVWRSFSQTIPERIMEIHVMSTVIFQPLHFLLLFLKGCPVTL